MAQRVNVVLVDDIDGSEAAETVTFGLDGAQYEIDLSADNADKLREALAPYVGHGRRAGGRRRSSGGSAGRSSASRSGSASGGPSAADIRVWARENGWEVPERGRVSAEVRDAYAAAH
ncbi:MAG TPA: Lsr2 family protein [Marmoricola sp.]|nr:Lsr2 family protein [Marmoricola sp.]